MLPIETTSEAAREIYGRIDRNLAIVRNRLGRALTLSEKILLGHLENPGTQDLVPGKSYLSLRPDRVVFQDVLGQSAMLQFMQTGRARMAVPTTIHCDHLIQARVDGAADLKDSLAENGEVYAFLKSAAARYGAGFWAPGAGIIHQVVLENYAFPGTLIIGTDSHTPNAGGLGACAVGVGGADAVEVIAGLPWEVLYPRRIAVHLTGKLSGWSSPKDVVLWVAHALTVSGGTNAIVEYIGPGARTISATGKATICNMGAELGATTSMFPADESMLRYLRATARGEIARIVAENFALLSPDPDAEADPTKYYDRVLELDLTSLEPMVSGPHTPDRVRPISALAAELANPENHFVDSVSTALIGSCTNSSYEDMGRAADIARQAASHGLKAAAEFLVSPGSDRVRNVVARDGQLNQLTGVGATVLAAACGPCIGQWRRQRQQTETNTIVTTFNRNFPRRNDGLAATMNFIASPEIVMAFAIAGRLSFNPLTDELTGADGTPFKLAAPAEAPDVPSRNFPDARDRYSAPPADGRAVSVKIAPGSERLQALTPWPAWNGTDFKNLPVLIKTRGKTTTDHISPAGPWLKYRGHLDRFSDNMFSGAENAFTGTAGMSFDVIDASTAPASKVARHYKSLSLPWVAIGDANYGEGSSREHAALSPRLLGCAAVIARSFARIHEANLKKQGLLALTFRETSDYDRIRVDDRIDLAGLKDLAPGRPVQAILHHHDGSAENLQLSHSYSETQLEWFRSGSALNCVARAA